MLPRQLSSRVLAALKDTPVVFVQGARQTGKSTLVKALTQEQHPARYLTLDDAGTLAAAQGDPQGFIANLGGPVVLDEAQRVPALARAIKLAVDANRQPGRFLLTGSASVLLVPKLSESLAGRMEVLTLWPLSQGEIAGTTENFIDAVFARKPPVFRRCDEGWSDLLKRMVQGGYPEMLQRAAAERRRSWFGSYITTILQRDVRDMAQIDGLAEMPRLLGLLASRSSALLNFSDLSRGLAMPMSTLKRYMTLLEATFLVQLLPAWSTNLGTRLVKSPKLLLHDTGLLNYLIGADESRLKADPMLAAPILENFVVMELQKQRAWSKAQPSLFHFRTPPGLEVDIVLENSAGQIVGIDIRASASVNPDDFRGLRALADMSGDRFIRGLVLYAGSETLPFGKGLLAAPAASLWSPAA
jgi:predicted AAA+ superfamily ATPase